MDPGFYVVVVAVAVAVVNVVGDGDVAESRVPEFPGGLRLGAELTKEPLQNLTALTLHDARNHLDAVIVPVEDVRPALFGIQRSKNDAAKSCLNHGPGAHRAGFQSHVQVNIKKPPGLEMQGGLLNRQELGVRQRVVVDFTAVIAATDDLAVEHCHCAHRNFSDGFRFVCELKCFRHELDMHALPGGFEPPAFGFVVRRSIQLS